MDVTDQPHAAAGLPSGKVADTQRTGRFVDSRAGMDPL